MSNLDANTWYRIFYTPYQTYILVAGDINASGTAGVDVLPMGSYSGYDDWAPVLIPETPDNTVQYGFRNRALKNDSLLAVFLGTQDTSVRVEIEGSANDFPLQTRWILTQYPQQNDTFYITNAGNSSSTYLSAAFVTQSSRHVLMQNVGTNLTGAGTWTFVSHIPVNPSSSTSSTSPSSATSTATDTAISSVTNSATSSPASSSMSSSSSQIPSNTSKSHSLSTGATAGIAVGCVIAVLLLVVLFISAFRNRRRRPVPALSAQEAGNSPLHEADCSSPQMHSNGMPLSDQKAELVGEPSPVARRYGDQQRFRHEMEATNS